MIAVFDACISARSAAVAIRMLRKGIPSQSDKQVRVVLVRPVDVDDFGHLVRESIGRVRRRKIALEKVLPDEVQLYFVRQTVDTGPVLDLDLDR